MGLGVFGLIGCISLSLSLALPTFFNNNNNKKIKNRCIKIARDNLIRIINLLYFCTALGVRWDVDIFKLIARA